MQGIHMPACLRTSLGTLILFVLCMGTCWLFCYPTGWALGTKPENASLEWERGSPIYEVVESDSASSKIKCDSQPHQTLS